MNKATISQSSPSYTGRGWKLTPTYLAWKQLPEMKRVHHRTRSALARLIDMEDDEAIQRLPWGKRLLCEKWQYVISHLDDCETYDADMIQSKYKYELVKECFGIYALHYLGKIEW